MAAIAVSPFVLKDVDLVIETDNYEAHVSQVLFQPSSQTVTWKGLTPAATFSDQTAATWTVQLTFAQDWATADSLSNYLLENAGEKVTAVFKPKKGTAAPTFTADVILAAPPIGGTVDQVATGQVTLGVDGAPVKSTS
jgi:hypothetical protein